MKIVLTPLAKSILISFGLTAGASATDAAIQKKLFGSGTTALIILNKEMEDIMKTVKSLEESGSWKKALMKQLKMKKNNKKMDFLVCY